MNNGSGQTRQHIHLPTPEEKELQEIILSQGREIYRLKQEIARLQAVGLNKGKAPLHIKLNKD